MGSCLLTEKLSAWYNDDYSPVSPDHSSVAHVDLSVAVLIYSRHGIKTTGRVTCEPVSNITCGNRREEFRLSFAIVLFVSTKSTMQNYVRRNVQGMSGPCQIGS